MNELDDVSFHPGNGPSGPPSSSRTAPSRLASANGLLTVMKVSAPAFFGPVTFQPADRRSSTFTAAATSPTWATASGSSVAVTVTVPEPSGSTATNTSARARHPTTLSTKRTGTRTRTGRNTGRTLPATAGRIGHRNAQRRPERRRWHSRNQTTIRERRRPARHHRWRPARPRSRRRRSGARSPRDPRR